MRALVKTKKEPGIWLEDRPIPSYGPNEVLIKIHKTAICGTDIHIYEWNEWALQTIRTPLIIGHEFMGEIIAKGEEVKAFEIGDKVSGEGHLTCGFCRNCRAGRQYLCRKTLGVGVNRDGAFADYLSLPAKNVIPIPNEISDDMASILDPLGNATHCALSFDVVGEDVLITGAGPIGLMTCAILRHIGARHVVITDINEYRLQLAKKMGASLAIHVQQNNLSKAMTQLNMTEGFDVGLEMSGNPLALNDMIQFMNHGGKIALLGIPPEQTLINWNHVIFKGLTLKGIYGREMFETWYKMIAMLQSGLNLSSLITHQFTVDEYQKAFKIMAEGKCAKVILNWV